MEQNDSNKPLIINFAEPKSQPSGKERMPLLSSHYLGWKKVNFDLFCYGNCETSVHVFEHHTIGLILNRGKVERKLNGVYRHETATRGSVAIIPAKVEHWSAWDIIARFAMISVSPQALTRIDPNSVNPDSVELIPTFAKSKPDRLLYGIGMAIEHYLETDPNDGGFYIEHLSNTLLAHLVRYYCSKKIRFKEYSGGLTGIKLEQAISYINDNLAAKIELEDIANELDISQYYFAHLFSNSIGISPYNYVIQQRIKKAKELLRNTKMPIAEIALACGFSSQSQMTMHFRKLTDTTPKKYRDA